MSAESLKMVDKALDKRVQDILAEYENETEWDYALLRQELLMHYLLTVPVLEGSDPPTTVEGISEVAVEVLIDQPDGKVPCPFHVMTLAFRPEFSRIDALDLRSATW